MKILLVIPTYNCAEHIPKVLKGINPKLLIDLHEVWIVDNQSKDNTVEYAKQVSERISPKIKVKIAKQNNSLGGTHKLAFNEGIRKQYSHVAILHGDNQALAEDLVDMIEKCRQNPEMSVLGSRFSKGSKLVGYDKKRIVGNITLNMIYSIVLKRKLNDLGSGLNLFSTKSIAKVRYMEFPNNLAFNYYLIKSLVKTRAEFVYHPIVWKENGQVSNTRNWDIFLKALKALFSIDLKAEMKNQATEKVIYGVTDV